MMGRESLSGPGAHVDAGPSLAVAADSTVLAADFTSGMAPPPPPQRCTVLACRRRHVGRRRPVLSRRDELRRIGDRRSKRTSTPTRGRRGGYNEWRAACQPFGPHGSLVHGPPLRTQNRVLLAGRSRCPVRRYQHLDLECTMRALCELARGYAAHVKSTTFFPSR
jgi:hypothetical protein